MKDVNGELQYRDKTYKIIFNLNVMEEIQKKYGSLQAWGNLTDGKEGEVDISAVIFSYMAMINEGLEIESEETGTDFKPLTAKQVGRIITEVGIRDATEKLNNTVIESTKDEKNA